jgi:hypothetical protein
LLIRIVPALAQILDFSLDTASIVLIAIPGTELRISGVHVSTKVTFTQLEDVISSSYSNGSLQDTTKPSGWGTSWSARFKESVNRTWEKAWGQTEGFASVALRVDRLTALPPHHMRNAKTLLIPVLSSLFDMKAPAHLEVSARFHPREGRVDEKSVRCSIRLSSIEITGAALNAVLEEYGRISQKPPSIFASIQLPESQVSGGVAQVDIMSRLKTVMVSLNPYTHNVSPITLCRLQIDSEEI